MTDEKIAQPKVNEVLPKVQAVDTSVAQQSISSENAGLDIPMGSSDGELFRVVSMYFDLSHDDAKGFQKALSDIINEVMPEEAPQTSEELVALTLENLREIENKIGTPIDSSTRRHTKVLNYLKLLSKYKSMKRTVESMEVKPE